jgi:uncharacterized coiled-coil DUF342 family protein
LETVTELADRKSEIQERIKAMEVERENLQRDVNELRERLEALELQRRAAILKSEIDVLKLEREALNKRASVYSSQGGS